MEKRGRAKAGRLLRGMVGKREVRDISVSILFPPFYIEWASSWVQSLSAVLKPRNSIAFIVLSLNSKWAKGIAFLVSSIFIT